MDYTSDYLAVLQRVFDFDLLKSFLSRPDFSFTFDAMHAITGAYAQPFFVDVLGAPLLLHHVQPSSPLHIPYSFLFGCRQHPCMVLSTMAPSQPQPCACRLTLLGVKRA